MRLDLLFVACQILSFLSELGALDAIDGVGGVDARQSAELDERTRGRVDEQPALDTQTRPPRQPVLEKALQGPGSENIEDFSKISGNSHELYEAAQPFKHIVIDNFVSAGFLSAVKDESISAYSSPEGRKLFRVKKTRNAHKMYTTLDAMNFHKAGKHATELLKFLNSKGFVQFLSNVTGIQKLLVDPQVTGAGMSRVPNGGFLSIHADFNKELQSARTKASPGWRRLNLLLYLNEHWKEEYGGSLELWQKVDDNFEYVKKVLPLFNRAMIFATTDESLHGHMDLVKHPYGVPRLTFSTYYYTKEREDPLISESVHSTIYPAKFHGTASFDRWESLRPQFLVN
mmetsp:Transcript_13760/g.23265  ORF Transcript_13760/g.23265 Transcript_13760/m.23265 type:complete len:343 (-) Transcript_13760:252-1280(-)|eukprot:CAMPEP_0198198342 /NCGR_PEP_ID=MMETSP1445-20131203/1824_1 /TAXON_ID=36898 /ORGANISM="Pyramimonas sp., Strain CCMP2087" /LENGTH=342 /DNA_ID=CAMNT_0043867883 /DNA_START=216 /DNA_END=1244 /DNA_ORIENTATION=+